MTAVDEWAAAFSVNERRLHDQMVFEQKRLNKAQEAKDARRDNHIFAFWIILGLCLPTGLVALLAIGGFREAAGNREKSILIQQERTKQIEACVTLVDLAERQLCFTAIGQSSVSGVNQ